MIDSLKPGQTIRCTVTKAPRNPAKVDTLQRLMRSDIDIKRGLRKAQRRRRQGMVVYNRGNRDWYKREICGKIVRVETGATWTMPYTPDLAPEFRSLDGYLGIEAV